MPTNSPGLNAIKTISMPVDLASAAESRAKGMGFRGFSQYIQRLIEQDLDARPPIVFQERGLESRIKKKRGPSSTVPDDLKRAAERAGEMADKKKKA
jgi:hypothetical protein